MIFSFGAFCFLHRKTKGHDEDWIGPTKRTDRNSFFLEPENSDIRFFNFSGSIPLRVELARVSGACFSRRMVMPYQIATLLYCFNEQDHVLLLERKKEPNSGLWSPCGGKLVTAIGESPYSCACREGAEEIGLQLRPSDLHLAGMISEHGYLGQSHWLMFLFEVKPKLKSLPPPHREGAFAFFPREELSSLPLPQTDREQIWPLFWKYRGGFFSAHCRTQSNGANEWTIEEVVACQ